MMTVNRVQLETFWSENQLVRRPVLKKPLRMLERVVTVMRAVVIVLDLRMVSVVAAKMAITLMVQHAQRA